MKYFTSESPLGYNWENVAVGFWSRYPNNYSKHVQSEDTIWRQVVGDRLYSRRLLMKSNRMPKWGERFISTRLVPVLEESVVDRVGRTLVTYTRNVSYTRVMAVEERCEYTQAEDCKTTLLRREAWISSGVRGFSAMIERFGFERFKHNATNANKGLLYILAQLAPDAAHKNNSASAASKMQSLMRFEPSKLVIKSAQCDENI